jgi:hypothetical protein
MTRTQLDMVQFQASNQSFVRYLSPVPYALHDPQTLSSFI